MKNVLLIILQVLLIIPFLTDGQNKRKKLKMELEENAVLVNNIKMDMQALARNPTKEKGVGFQKGLTAIQYITEQYKQLAVDPAGSNGYIQEFEIDEGKQPEPVNTFLKINENKAELNSDFIPLAFSAVKTVKGLAAVTLNESAQPWFIDLKEILEEHQSEPQFDMEGYIKKEASKIMSRGATALLLYNSSHLIDHLQFNKSDKSSPSSLPIFYITKVGMKKYCSDVSATLNIELGIEFTRQVRKFRNVVGFINNNAATTVILAAPYNFRNSNSDTNASSMEQSDENLCGATTLIELARLLKKTPLKNNNYILLHFSEEEMNLFGSNYWLEHPTKNIKPNYALNLYLEGLNETTPTLTIKGSGISPGWDNFLANKDQHLIIREDSSASNFIGQTAFYRKEIPSLFFYTDKQTDYNKSINDKDKINFDNDREIIQFTYKFIASTEIKGKLVFAKIPKVNLINNANLAESLGIIPDYEFGGTGVRVSAISQGKLAEKAGLQVGDVILQLGDNKFEDLVGYMQALNKLKKGDKTKLRIQGEKEFEIEF